MYADRTTESMQRAIDETNRRRDKQMLFNADHGITPKGVSKRIKDIIDGVYDPQQAQRELRAKDEESAYAAMDEEALAHEIRRVEKEMLEHARNLEFEQAAQARDHLRELKQRLFGPSHDELPATPKPSPRVAGRRERRPYRR
jgi:excinuclease ABC subunit B